MNGRAYYNEFDRFAAAWLRELIAAGHIPAGDVDERSIADVTPGDLAGYAGDSPERLRAAADYLASRKSRRGSSKR